MSLLSHHRRAARFLVVPLLLGAVTACTSSSDGGSAGSGPSVGPSAGASTESPGPPPVVKTQVAPGTAKNFVGARSDVTGLQCKHAGDAWTSSGTVTNPGRAVVDYRIYTAFLDAANQTRGLVQTNVARVAPRASKKWAGRLDIDAADLRCVLRVERTNGKA